VLACSQQKQVKRWLEAAGTQGLQDLDSSHKGISGTGNQATGAHTSKEGRSQSASGAGLGVAALLAQSPTRQQLPGQQEQQESGPGSVHSMPGTSPAAVVAEQGPDEHPAPEDADITAAVGRSKRRARSHSPVRQGLSAAPGASRARPSVGGDLAAGVIKPSQQQVLSLPPGSAGHAGQHSGPTALPGAVQHARSSVQVPGGNGSIAAGLRAAAAAVVSQLRDLGAQELQGELQGVRVTSCQSSCCQVLRSQHMQS